MSIDSQPDCADTMYINKFRDVRDKKEEHLCN